MQEHNMELIQSALKKLLAYDNAMVSSIPLDEIVTLSHDERNAFLAYVQESVAKSS